MSVLSPLSPLTATAVLCSTRPGLTADEVIERLTLHLGLLVGPRVRALVRAQVAFAQEVGLDPFVPVGQSLVELGNYGEIAGLGWEAFKDPARNNPASIGIVGNEGGEDTDMGLGWESPEMGARAQVVHLLSYADWTPMDAPTRLRAAAFLKEWGHINPRLKLIPLVNVNSAKTLEWLQGKYAMDPRYAAKIADRTNEVLALTAVQEDEMVGEYNFDPGLVPFPPKGRLLIVKKPGERAGFDRVVSRKNRIAGVCDHITAGRGTIEGYAAFFGTGGERAWDALVDILIDRDGNWAWYNYPYDDALGGTRAGWANGGADGLEGDGPAYVRVFGIEGVNSCLVSKEHVAVEGEDLTPAQEDTSVRITAAVMQRAKVKWDEYPLNSNVGCVTELQHYEFATKPCPGTVVRNSTDRRQNQVRSLLKIAQTTPKPGTTPSSTTTTRPPVTPTTPGPITPVPPTKPVENPAHDLYPDGMDSLEKAEAAFGTGEKHYADGHDHGFGFNPTSAVSLAWLKEFAEEGIWPQVDEWWELENSNGTIRQVVTFKRSPRVLVHMADRAGWRWI